jgi:hypothetical protein
MASGLLDSSPLRGSNGDGGRRASAIPPPTHQQKRGTKRSADEALLLTPPRTIKRESRKRIGKRTVTAGGASGATTITRTTTRTKLKSKSKSTPPVSRGSRSGSKDGHETELDAVDTDAEEGEEPSLGDGKGRRLDFGPQPKKRRTGSLDARLESLLENFNSDDPENPFWDGSAESKKTSPRTELAEKTEKSVRIRSPTPPVVHFQQGKAPVSPPPSKKRTVKTGKRKVKTDQTIIEEVVEEVPVDPSIEATTDEKTIIEDEPPTLAPSTPRKGKRSLSPVRDSPNNPFLDVESPCGEPPEPRTPTTHAEKPTITYVL